MVMMSEDDVMLYLPRLFGITSHHACKLVTVLTP